tara:strand:+ start:655 stop:3987 length:3333 start_codon:yes stop_codon:yes gene_type:complete
MSDEQNPSEQLNEYIKIYLGNKSNLQDELEIRFGTKHWNTLSKIDFNNIIEKIKSYGFKLKGLTDGNYTLNIQNEYSDPKTGRVKMSNIRTTIIGIHNIQKYCKENSLDKESLPYDIEFLQKFSKKKYRNSKEFLKPIDFHDFHFRVNFKEERKLHKNKPEIEHLLDNWKNTKKNFRFIKRFTFVHADYPFKFDCSIIKTSKKKKYYISEYSIQDANVFNNPENYEIEIELIEKAKTYQANDLQNILKKGIKIILSGWQLSNFPISFKQIEDVLTKYKHLIYEDKHITDRRIHSGDFIGPSSISLELQNIISQKVDNNTPNINTPYTVTDKADGMRKLLYISNKGLIYLINTNMQVQFTGSITKHKNCFNTIIDGEHILHDKKGNFINLFLCFDIYYKNKKNMKGYPFTKAGDIHYSNKKIEKDIFRLTELNAFLKVLDAKCIINNFDFGISIKLKTFYSNIDSDIFTQCKIILDGQADGTLFNYETDGLIFTPATLSVGSNKTGEITPPKKTTWIHSLKWKPPEYNSIDFLVRTKKTQTGEDFIGNIYNDGDNTRSNKYIDQYKTLILHVGFNERFDGFLNPCDDVIKDNISYNNPDHNKYKAMPFMPSNPTPNYPIYLCNILLKQFGTGNKQLFTEDNKQILEDNTIVEFRFDKTEKPFWQWKPIRVRYDKTADYQRKHKISCNAYKTATSVWRTIHNPVTSDMLTTGNNIPEIFDNDIYYNRTTKKTFTRNLRDFHNKYVKRKLINNITKFGDTLIDMTVGKAGDLQKWINARLSFVLGIDIAKDNIENRIDGACARYLIARRKYNSMPKCLFVHGNSSLNIREGEACYDEKGKQIIKAINGEGPQDENLLGTGVYKQYGKGKNGYNIVSNQFSIHYFFENINTFHNFIRNVSENCKIGGYFIGCCYNGKKIFKELQEKQIGESIFELNSDQQKIWGIEKAYNNETFPNNANSLGYKINVYQESINKTFSEYLVNFEYLTRIMENYGFTPISDDNAKTVGFPTSIGSFEDLYDQMCTEIKDKRIKLKNIGKASKMNSIEKRISFMNNYFIYKKIRNTNAKEISIQSMAKTEEQIQSEKQQTSLYNTSQKIPRKKNIKKYKRKFKMPV